MSGPLLASAGVSAIQLGAAAAGGPLLYGLMAKVRARAEGRAGAPVRQPLLDLRKLAAKERIHAEHSSAVLPLAPLVLIASTAAAVVIAPLISTGPALGRTSDVFAVVFLLLLGSVAVALAGLDAGTAFGGMGASRAMTIGALAEPALLVAVLALSLQAGTSNLPRDRHRDTRPPAVGGQPAAAARPGRPAHRYRRRDRPDPGRQSLHSPGADDDP